MAQGHLQARRHGQSHSLDRLDTDVTERKRAEAAQRESEQRYARV